MRNVLLCAAGAVMMLGARPALSQDPNRVDWLTDRNKAVAEARRTGKPIWVLFR